MLEGKSRCDLCFMYFVSSTILETSPSMEFNRLSNEIRDVAGDSSRDSSRNSNSILPCHSVVCSS